MKVSEMLAKKYEVPEWVVVALSLVLVAVATLSFIANNKRVDIQGGLVIKPGQKISFMAPPSNSIMVMHGEIDFFEDLVGAMKAITPDSIVSNVPPTGHVWIVYGLDGREDLEPILLHRK